MRIIVDYGKCTGLGLCEAAAAEVFEIGDDGGLVLLREDIPPNLVDETRAAVRGCPTDALRLVE